MFWLIGCASGWKRVSEHGPRIVFVVDKMNFSNVQESKFISGKSIYPHQKPLDLLTKIIEHSSHIFDNEEFLKIFK